MIVSQQRSTPPFSLDAGKAESLLVTRWEALGTTCELQFPESLGENGQRFAEKAIQWVADFEARYSRFRPDSVISRINAAAGGDWVPIDEDVERVLDVCGTLFQLTRGILDVTALPLQRLWNYRAGVPQVPSREQIQTALALVGWGKVERRRGAVRLPLAGMGIDLGGWGKEYAVDAVIELARQHGIGRLLVDFGHDIRVLGTPPGRPGWHIGLEDPDRPGAHRGSIAVIDRAVASSGDYQRGFTVGGRRYGHIMDPRTGFPVSNGARQVTVIAPTCLQAGLYSTTCFVLGPAEGLRFLEETMGVEGCIRAANTLYQSKGFLNYVVSAP